jgi:hypothetical protein
LITDSPFPFPDSWDLILNSSIFMSIITVDETNAGDKTSRIRIRLFSHPGYGSGSKHCFVPDPGSDMRSGMQTYFFLAS